jgi:hypothetical protein
MKIILNENLKPIQSRVDEYDRSYAFKSLVNKHYPLTKEFKYNLILGNNKTNLQNGGFLGLLSYCYSSHHSISISPEDFWILMLSEITKEVASNVEDYRQFFTQSKEKETISVFSDSLIELPVDSVSKILASKVLFDSSVLFQNFSTETPIVKETIQALFCDMAAPYYSYSMFCCGIPSISVKGKKEDWIKVKNGIESLIKQFNTVNLNKYLDKISPILNNFIMIFDDVVDFDFWKDIFTQKNVGSGGQLQINGWIQNMFVKDFSEGAMLNFFTDNCGVVQYEQLQTKKEFVALYGGLNYLIDEDGFHKLKYEKYVFEKVKV